MGTKEQFGRERQIQHARNDVERIQDSLRGNSEFDEVVRELGNARARLDDALDELRNVYKKSRRKRVHLIAILDRSGSMQGLEKDTIGSFNRLVEEQRTDTSTDTSVTLVTFAGRGDYRVLYEAADISRVKALTEQDYRVGGSTALNDAIKGTLQKYADGRSDADAYLVLVITDGEENNSATSKEDALALIKRLEGKGTFTFTYVGSHAATWSEARGYGVLVTNTLSYSPDSAGIGAAYRSVSMGLSNLKYQVSNGGPLSSNNLYTPSTTVGASDATGTAPSDSEGPETL